MANAIHPLSGADYILEQQLKAAGEVALSDAVATAITTAVTDADIPGAVTTAVTTAVTAADISGAAATAVTTAVTAADISGKVDTAVAAAITASNLSAVFTGADDPVLPNAGDMWIKEDSSIHVYNGDAWKAVTVA